MTKIKNETMDVDGDQDGQDVNITKRKSCEPPIPKTMKKKKVSQNTVRNAVQVLNEKFGTSVITYNYVGSAQNPLYTASAVVEDVSFEGEGPSKVAARRDFAVKALAALLDLVLPEDPPQEDVSAQQFSVQAFKQFSHDPYIDFANPHQCYQQAMPLAQQSISQPVNLQPAKKKTTLNEVKARSQPVMMLSELFPNMAFDWNDENGRGDRQFKVEGNVEGRQFFGEGRSKRVAKLNLAKAILLCMYDVHDFVEPEVKEQKEKTTKFPVTQLKDLIGEDNIIIEVTEVESQENEEKSFHATIVVKGVAYEAIGRNRNAAKIRAAKKALDVLKPKKEINQSCINKHGVDINKHPVQVFIQHYPNVEFVQKECKAEEGGMENNIEANVDGKVFSATESTKKKAKLRLVLQVFQELKKTPITEWTAKEAQVFL